MYYKTASIILNNSKKPNTVSDVFISQVDKVKEDLAGKIFILAEIESQKTEAIKVLNFLINNLNFNYYQNDKIILKEKIESITIESIFETSLAKTNKDLLEFLEREKIKINPYSFNITVAILYKNEIHISTVGKNKNLLLYKEKIEDNTKKNKRAGDDNKTKEAIYKIADVCKTGDSTTNATTLNKLFSDVVSGNIPPGGYFVIINEALSEYISNKQLVRIITTIAPRGAAEQIKNTLFQINALTSFLGIIIKSTTTPFSIGEQNSDENKLDDYRPRITMTEERVEEILKPSGIINIKKVFKNFVQRFFNQNRTTDLNISSRPSGEKLMFKERIFFKKRIPSLKKVYLFLLKTTEIVFVLFVFVFKKVLNKRNIAKIFHIMGHIFHTKKTSFITSKKRTKLLLITSIILFALFTANLVRLNKTNKIEEEKKQFNTLISGIEKNQNKIEANLLYNNKAKAKELLEESDKLLKTIPLEEVSQKESIRELFVKQQELEDKIRIITTINNPKELANFTNLNNKAIVANIILLDGTLYCGDSEEKSIYKIDLEEDIVTAIYNNNDDIEKIFFPTLSNQGGIYYLDENKIISMDKNEKVTLFDINLKSSLTEISDIEAYGNNLYIINKKRGQIYKFSKRGDVFTDRENWLNKKEDLTNAVDLFIDGSIYIFYKNGRIKKYLRGGEQEFSIDEMYLPIKEASDFKIMNNNIYVLEPLQKRLIIFGKYGNFIKQYVFDSLDNIKGFAISKNEKNAYILDTNSVYEIELK